MPFKSAAMYGIQSHPDRFQVIIKRAKLQWNRTFAFSTYGGKESAMVQAQSWRDEIVRTHPPIARRDKARTLIKTNTSGIAGVHAVKHPDGTPRMWVARTNIGSDKAVSKAFSVGRWGEQAKTLAIAEREKQLLLLEGRTQPHPREQALRTAAATQAAFKALPKSDPTARAVLVKSNNTSGVAGVYLDKYRDGRPKAWMASTCPARGPSLCKSFSIVRFGDAGAKALAVAERQRQLVQAAENFYRASGNASERHQQLASSSPTSH